MEPNELGYEFSPPFSHQPDVTQSQPYPRGWHEWGKLILKSILPHKPKQIQHYQNVPVFIDSPCARTNTHTEWQHGCRKIPNLLKRDIWFWSEDDLEWWIKKRLNNGIIESWKAILSKLSLAGASECRRSLCMASRRCISLQAEQQRTMEPQLTKEEKNNNQTKNTCRIESSRPLLL